MQLRLNYFYSRINGQNTVLYEYLKSGKFNGTIAMEVVWISNKKFPQSEYVLNSKLRFICAYESLYLIVFITNFNETNLIGCLKINKYRLFCLVFY